MIPHSRHGTNVVTQCGGVAPPTSTATLTSSQDRKSLLFESTSNHVLRFEQVAGDANNWTVFFTLKRTQVNGGGAGTRRVIMGPDCLSSTTWHSGIALWDDDTIHVRAGNKSVYSTCVFRDTSAWVAVMVTFDGTNIKIMKSNVDVSGTTATATGYTNRWGTTGIGFQIGDSKDWTAPHNPLDGYITMLGRHDGVAHADMSAFGAFDSNTGQWVSQDPDTTGWINNSFYISGKENITDDFCNVINYGIGAFLYQNSISNGGVDFIMSRRTDIAQSMSVFDTERGDGNYLYTDSNTAEAFTADQKFIDGGQYDASAATGEKFAFTLKKDPAKGFNIVTWAGDGSLRGILHGLPSKPSMVIIFDRVSGEATVWFDGLTSDSQYLDLHNTVAMAAIGSGSLWDNTSTDATTFYVDGSISSKVNHVTGNYVGYFFCDVPGYIASGLVTGNAAVDPGFPTKAFLSKCHNAVSTWEMQTDINHNDCQYLALDSTAVPTRFSRLIKDASSPTNLLRSSWGGAETRIWIAFADTSYLKEFATSDFGSVEFDVVNFPSWENQYSDSPFNNRNTLNPLQHSVQNSSYSQGNLVLSNPGGSTGAVPQSGINIPLNDESGVPYVFEFSLRSGVLAGAQRFAVLLRSDTVLSSLRGNGTSANITGSVPAFGIGDIVTMAITPSTGSLSVSVNGINTSVVTFTVPPEGSLNVGLQIDGFATNAANVSMLNFGQKPIIYPPAGTYKTISSVGLADTYPIVDSRKFFDVISYTGNGAANTITGLDFEPRMLMIKGDNTSYWAMLLKDDSDTWHQLACNTSAAEVGVAMSSISGSGFSFTGDNTWNTLGINYIVYAWAVDPCGGLDILSWVGNSTPGRQLPQDLGARPELFLAKGRDSVSNWNMWVDGVTNDSQSLLVDTTSGISTTTNAWSTGGNTTTTTMGVGSGNASNANGVNFLGLAFRSIPGFSKVGTYVGNNSTNGVFIPLDFKPKLIIIKNTVAGTWQVFDTVRDEFNPIGNFLSLDSTSAEIATDTLDILSNGFKLRIAATGPNAAQTYMYWAFSECPQAFATAR